MEHQCDFKIGSRFDSREAAQISGLISDLDRILRIIDLEITAQEEDARVFDASKSAYPISARMLRARRDNLAHTIGSLHERLASLIQQTGSSHSNHAPRARAESR
ncbi:MAG TPA: hypothetical protein VJV58_16315 [Bradyrhizobium sp.]|jgi:hypothetical protein|uniref:hypothetical protein n=1 Tax=Bradyrhizobium sp. TaxID=376 RepID=UPI002B4A288E|nr:hypothetical protein [Bradyrhizobium sp.]HKO72491.1 hypothetical protein [Bradyrhizobium sp.]